MRLLLPAIAALLTGGIAQAQPAKPTALCKAVPGLSLVAAEQAADIFRPDACDPYSLAVQAYVWGLPLVEAAKIRLFFTKPADPFVKRLPSVAGAALNHFGHGRILANPDNKSGVGPNNDTLYSNAAFDLDSGPFVVKTPDFGDRYYTFSIAHPDSTTSDSLGQRTHGSQLPPLFLYRRGYAGAIPSGVLPVESPNRYMFMWGRTLVRPGEDLANIHRLQDSITVQRFVEGRLEDVGSPPAQQLFPAPRDDGMSFLRQLAVVLADADIPPGDRAVVARLNRLGLTGKAELKEDWSVSERAAILRGLKDGEAIVARMSRRFGTFVGGWSVNAAGGRFGTDYLLRAAVAKDQIFVTVPEEAIYPIARVDNDGTLLDGRQNYRIHFKAPPPVRGFWSITLYGDDGAMVHNPINRYSIGDRSPDLRPNADGSIDISLSRARPATGEGNWLPTPDGPFYLMMRLYMPNSAIQSGRWVPPPIEAAP